MRLDVRVGQKEIKLAPTPIMKQPPPEEDERQRGRRTLRRTGAGGAPPQIMKDGLARPSPSFGGPATFTFIINLT